MPFPVNKYMLKVSNGNLKVTDDNPANESIFTKSSHCKESVLKYFAKFIGKHLCQSLLFNKVT